MLERKGLIYSELTYSWCFSLSLKQDIARNEPQADIAVCFRSFTKAVVTTAAQELATAVDGALSHPTMIGIRNGATASVSN